VVVGALGERRSAPVSLAPPRLRCPPSPGQASTWVLLGVYESAAIVKAEPFDAIELDLAVLWSKPASPGA
jgi:hypothetical protein